MSNRHESIWTWPMEQFLEALIDAKIIDRSDPRPCIECKDRMVYGSRRKTRCGFCKTLVLRKRIDACDRAAYVRGATKRCADCGAPIHRLSFRCIPCYLVQRKVTFGKRAA